MPSLAAGNASIINPGLTVFCQAPSMVHAILGIRSLVKRKGRGSDSQDRMDQIFRSEGRMKTLSQRKRRYSPSLRRIGRNILKSV
jgi:hypothetical protein